ncbi:MAG: hypothetical protein K8T25_23855 [Planctomycetia bacterium]|nr:hypothetical protein [Planctomycetia bacterium]
MPSRSTGPLYRSTQLRWTKSIAALCCAVVACELAGRPALAQQVTITTPNQNFQNSFFENNGVNFGFNLRGGNPNGRGTRVVGLLPNGAFTPNGDIQFRQGSADAAQPQFGGATPGSGATTGFAIRGKGGDAFFNINAGQGSSTSHTMEAPMVTVMNGQAGSFSDQIQTPFVTSVTPVVGGWGPGARYGVPTNVARQFAPTMPVSSPVLERVARLRSGEVGGSSSGGAGTSTPAASKPAGFQQELANARNSTAGQPAQSLAEMEARHAAEQQGNQQEIRALLDRARQAEEAGKAGAARVYYRMAARDGSGELRRQAEQKLRELSAGSATTGDETP